MIVERYMTKNVITVKSDDSLLIAAKKMKQNMIRHVPVVGEDNKLVGIISNRDIHKHTPPPGTVSEGEEHDTLVRIKVEEAMARHPMSVHPDTPLEDVATLMRDEKIGALPVTQDSKLVGIISESDIFNAFTDVIRLLKKKGVDLEQYKPAPPQGNQ